VAAGSRITPARGYDALGKRAGQVTQKFMGANEMLKRLGAQTGSEEMAKALLVKRGQMTESGAWTKEGAKRNAMTAEERAIDRASTASGNAKSKYVYNPGTNRATLKR
jgi:hypothetical protein